MVTETDGKDAPVETRRSGKRASKDSAPAPRREIPGNLPYLTASGTLKKALDRLVEAQRPEKFSTDFLENVLKLTGGAARATIPILKKMKFLNSDGTPTELYAKFRTAGGQGPAALQGLKNAFSEIFRRSEYAHSADDAKLKDIIVEITGLKPSEPVAMAIRSTFKVINSYVPAGLELGATPQDASVAESDDPDPARSTAHNLSGEASGIRLAYNINIVLPETSDLTVLNAIFRSIRENLMQ